jgi:choline dehydrogenase-like flavoprotein
VERVTVTPSVGQRWEVVPRILVLACGAIENARLLLASDSQCPAGVGNARDQVGRYFMDHPKATAGTIALTPSGPRPDGAYWARKKLYGTTARWGLRLSTAAQADRGALNSHVFLDPVHATEAEPAIEALKSFYTGKRSGSAALPALRQVTGDLPAAAEFLRYKATGRGHLAALELTTFLEQPPLARNRVVLSSEHDDLGCRRARVDWSISDLERHSLRQLHAVIADDVRRRGLGTLHSPFLSPDRASWPRFRDASHHSGTTRMGTDPATSVVDPAGQVHGVENLFVAGSSVFPTVGYANPTFTIVALALRLADEVARRLSHHIPIDGAA